MKMSKLIRWFVGAGLLSGALAFIIVQPIPFLFYKDLPNVAFLGRALYVILLASALCLYRVWKGPTAADRVVAVDIMGVLIVGLCAILSIATGRSWYINIGIAWTIQVFVSILSLSKYLEGKGFDE